MDPFSSSIRIFFIFVTIICPISSYAQQTTLERYKFDPLGRLTRVDVNGQTKVAYCYDAAGNRKSVTATGEQIQDCTDIPEIPVIPTAPPIPTQLDQSSHQGGGCYIRWNSPTNAGITHFHVKLSSGGNIIVVPGNKRYFDHNTSCFAWISACNGDICSDRANFIPR